MDDLLKAFRTEASQDLDRGEADLTRLRTAPNGMAEGVSLKRLLGTIQEMSIVLGQRRLAEAAARGTGALEAALAAGPEAVGRAVPIVADSLSQIRTLLHALAGDETAIQQVDRPASAADSPAAPDIMDQDAPEELPLDAAEPLPTAVSARVRRRWYRPRNLLFAGGTSLMAAVAALVLVLLSADPNEYRGTLEDAIRDATGRAVTIGSVDLAISLTPTVVLQDVTLANASWGSRPRMIAADRLEVQMSLLPLLRGEFDAKRFVLRGADILLEVDGSGAGNWIFDGGADAAASDGVSLPQLGRVTVEDSTLAYRDAATGETERIQVRQLTARQLDPAAPVDIDIDAELNGQPVRLAGTLGPLHLLDRNAPYPVDFSGEVAGLAVSVVGEIAQPQQARGYALNLTLKGPSLAGIGAMTATGLPPGGPVDVAARIEDADAGIRFRDLAGRIGNSDLAGTVTVLPGSPNWRIDADLTSANLDLHDFILPREDDGVAVNDPRIFTARPLPHRWIGRIDMNAKLAAQKILHGEHALTDAKLEGTIVAGLLTLTELHFGYAGGSVALKGSVDVNGTAPAWNLQASARRLAAGDFLERVLGLTLIGGGEADIEAVLTAGGRSFREMAMTADGTVGLSVVDGRINDDLMKLFLTDLEQALSFDGSGARLRCLTAVYPFTDGIGRSRPFVADTGAAVVVGEGSINLREETIAMRFEPTARELSLAALPVPVDVTGPLAHPNVSPDAAGATANVVSEAASIASLGVADAFLDMVGEEPLSNSGPIASCRPLPGAMAATKKTATKKKTATTDSTQQATTETAPKKKTKQATSGNGTLLDDAGAALNSLGSSIGDFIDNNASSGSSRKPGGNKKD